MGCVRPAREPEGFKTNAQVNKLSANQHVPEPRSVCRIRREAHHGETRATAREGSSLEQLDEEGAGAVFCSHRG